MYAFCVEKKGGSETMSLGYQAERFFTVRQCVHKTFARIRMYVCDVHAPVPHAQTVITVRADFSGNQKIVSHEETEGKLLRLRSV